MSGDPRHVPSAPSGGDVFPPQLADALAELLAEALVAELMESPNPTKEQAELDATVESPPGHDRRHPGLEARVQSHD